MATEEQRQRRGIGVSGKQEMGIRGPGDQEVVVDRVGYSHRFFWTRINRRDCGDRRGSSGYWNPPTAGLFAGRRGDILDEDWLESMNELEWKRKILQIGAKYRTLPNCACSALGLKLLAIFNLLSDLFDHNLHNVIFSIAIYKAPSCKQFPKESG
jgi:hypothetical protein